ncbi:uncharacterized protein LOC108598240 [Drosophila busckii]|uniref:uncharacterized protein LOC108598240 n=1 Tax=Drosophila busckii TaxID=30019 RepID=UPI001432B154|nr:uncharacterized protein LOC108598240 [Drosophila busckii]
MCKFALILFVFLIYGKYTRAEVFEECENVPEETFVATSDSCQSYFYCNGDDSMRGDCPPGEYFDGETCDVAENVPCFLDNNDNGEEVTDSAEEPEEPQKSDEPDMPDPTPPTINAPSTVDVLNIAPVIKPSCPVSDDPTQVIMMANNASCTDYYLCYHGHAMEMHCPDQLHFNAHTGQCDYPEKAHCPLNQLGAHKCLPQMTDFFPHPDKCSYFYYCIKGFLTLQQCPFYYGWDIEKRSCVQLSLAQCYGGARRAPGDYMYETLRILLPLTASVGLLLLSLPLPATHAAFLIECEGVIISRIPNPDAQCSEYIYCDGDDSFFCNDDCTEPVICHSTTPEDSINSTSTEPASTMNTTAALTMTTTKAETTALTQMVTSIQPQTIPTTVVQPKTSTPRPTTSSTTINSSNVHPSVLCRQSGQSNVYPYPANDNYYYQCIAGYLLLQECGQHFYFDESLRQCIADNPHSSYQLYFVCENMQIVTASCCLSILLLALALCQADIFEQCEGSKDGVFIGSSQSCGHYIFCNGEDSYDGQCPDGDYFNAEEQVCEFMDGLNCRPDSNNLNELPNTQTTMQGMELEVTTPVRLTSSTTSIRETTVSPAAAVVSLATLNVPTTSTIFTTVSHTCPATDDPGQIVLLAHHKSCSDYFICYYGKPLAMSCAPMMHFNSRTAKCDFAERVKCVVSTINAREQCKPHTEDVFPHPDNCNYFYYCRNGFLMVQQCPFFYGWDYEQRSCVTIAKAKCFDKRRRFLL